VFLSFNSLMVRLKDQRKSVYNKRKNGFQFLDGAIKRRFPVALSISTILVSIP